MGTGRTSLTALAILTLCLVAPSPAGAASTARHVRGTALRASEPRTDAAVSAACTVRNLSIAAIAGDAQSNDQGMLIRFHNKGSTDCTLHGYPRVVAVRSGATATAIPALSVYIGGWIGSEPPVVVLVPGKSASVIVASGAQPREGVSTACSHERYTSIRVSLRPNTPDVILSAALPKEGLNLPTCTSVRVTPYAPGLSWWSGPKAADRSPQLSGSVS